MYDVKFSDMTCAATVSNAIHTQEGIVNLNISYKTRNANIKFDNSKITIDDIKKAINTTCLQQQHIRDFKRIIILNFHTKDMCPICKNKAKEVSPITIKSLVKDEYLKELSSVKDFYYCQSPSCEVIYFKLNEIIKQEFLSQEVGLKEWASSKTICYCFNWSQEVIANEIKEFGRTNAIDDISEKMKNIGCDCEHNNPSGKCCLKDVKKVIKELS